MKTLFNKWITCISVSVALAMSACASTKVISSRVAPDFRSSAYKHVFVIGVSNDSSVREQVEHEFVQQWTTHGVKAVASSDLLPAATPLSRETVAPIVKSNGFDGVLVLRVLEKRSIQPGETGYLKADTEAQGDAENLNTAMQVLLAPPVSTSPYRLVSVAANFYDVASSQKLWATFTETKVRKDIPKKIHKFVSLILKRFYADGRP